MDMDKFSEQSPPPTVQPFGTVIPPRLEDPGNPGSLVLRSSMIDSPSYPTFPDRRQIPTPVKKRRLPRFLIPAVTFLVGILVGMGGLLAFFFLAPEAPLAPPEPAPPAEGAIVVQVSPVYIAQATEKNVKDVKNVQVTLEQNKPIVMTGNYTFSMLGFPITRHFKLQLQPHISACQLQMKVVHADLGGIPVTTFVRTMEGEINQELQVRPTNLPQGFTYCLTGVRTQPDGFFVIYSATPV